MFRILRQCLRSSGQGTETGSDSKMSLDIGSTTPVFYPINSSNLLPNRFLRIIYRPFQNMVENYLRIPELNRIYHESVEDHSSADDFCRKVLRHLQISYFLSQADEDSLRSIEGPLILVTNHPYCIVDAICIADLMGRFYPKNWKILSDCLFEKMSPPGLQKHLIRGDPLVQTGKKGQLNRSVLKKAYRFLENKGCLAMFGTDRVAHFNRPLGAMVDPPWSEDPLKLAARSGAAIACLHIPGQNSPEFLKIPLNQSRRRDFRVCREVFGTSPCKLKLSLVLQLSPDKVKHWANLRNGTARLRAHCFFEADKQSLSTKSTDTSPTIPSMLQTTEASAELKGLSAEHRLLRKGDLELIFVQGRDAPRLLDLLGRVREATFRAVGQGVGKDVDLSPEDDYSHHLVAWDHSRDSIAGAYRVGIFNSILKDLGRSGLYLNHSFKIAPSFYESFRDSVELSRSFVLPKYQRDNRVLPFLWTGLGRICKDQGIDSLFGSVTISKQFHPASRALLVEFLRREYPDSSEVCDCFEARSPFHPESRYHTLVAEAYAGESISKLNPIIRHIEEGREGIPPLIRYYCQLGARFIDYNISADFQDAIYCLLRVDLPSVPMGYKKRFCVSL